MSSLGSRLKQACENKRLTQIHVAKKLGISNGTLSGYERNYCDPDTETLSQLASI
ncbi:helix-turn-helix transcriptional regulator [Brevibacillus laterosporus]|uniref:helix-turn-helix domain-containing protein n=1 Tax=Brevibacillus laterosporus TaxID=1465 RepID=UPI003D1B7C9E